MQHIHPLGSVIPPETPLEVLIATAFFTTGISKKPCGKYKCWIYNNLGLISISKIYIYPTLVMLDIIYILLQLVALISDTLFGLVYRAGGVPGKVGGGV